MHDHAKILIHHVLLSVFVAPRIISLRILRLEVLSMESVAAIARDYAFAYLFVTADFQDRVCHRLASFRVWLSRHRWVGAASFTC